MNDDVLRSTPVSSVICTFTLLMFVFVPAVGFAGPGHDNEHATNSTQTNTETSDLQQGAETDHEQTENQATGHTEGHTEQSTSNDTGVASGSSTSEGHHPAAGESVSFMPGLAGAPNVHPMLVHFPIAFLVTSTLLFLLSWIVYPDRLFMLGRWLYWLGLMSLPVVAASGFWAIGGWGEGHVVGHRNWMLLTTFTAYLLFVVARYVSNRERMYRVVLTIGMIVVTLFMTIGADRGAWLVFVEGSGVQSAQQAHNH